MPIDVGGSYTVGGVNGSIAFSVAAGANAGIQIDTSGRTLLPNQVGFVAGWNGTDPGWQNMAFNAWGKNTWFNNTVYNKGNGFSTSTTRFTAPVAGAYMFMFSSYNTKQAPATTGHIWYVAFGVNGAVYANFAIRGHTDPQGYSADSQHEDIVYLNVGDYVEVFFQENVSSGCQWYPNHSVFAGFLVG
jgi:hypothetical protein